MTVTMVMSTPPAESQKLNKERNLGDAHYIITFFSSIGLSCPAWAIFSPRLTETLTDG